MINAVKIDVDVKDGEKFYPIIIGENLIENLDSYIYKYSNAKKVMIVTNSTIFKIYKEYLMDIRNAYIYIIRDGEKYKNIEEYRKIIDRLILLKFERDDVLVAFGGGVVGDLTGFCASSYLRGIDFIQVPTTLLSQVDSSIGGKVGVNHRLGKNLIGAFFQPKVVISDINTLRSLDSVQLKAGLGEVLKYGFIEKNCICDDNFNFFEFLNLNREKILNRDKELMQQVIRICCEMKRSVVQNDERETNLRSVLNLGHTFGHAIENITKYKKYTHGQAVVIGMKMAFDVSFKENKIDKTYYREAIDLLNAYNIINLSKNVFEIGKLKDRMLLDKKVKNNRIRLVLPVERKMVKIFDKIEL